jgi:hypothetical protein
MKKLIWIILLSVLAVSMTKAQTAAPTIVTAAQINGTWRTKHGELKIWALGHQKLKVEFSGSYEYKSPQGPMANTGEGSGIADIDADTITFKPDGAEDECAITMKYKEGRLSVSQEGICGFGHNVTAAGDYRRVSSSKPKFGED